MDGETQHGSYSEIDMLPTLTSSPPRRVRTVGRSAPCRKLPGCNYTASSRRWLKRIGVIASKVRSKSQAVETMAARTLHKGSTDENRKRTEDANVARQIV